MQRGPLRIDDQGIIPPSAFAIYAESVGEAVAVRLEGELDMAASHALRSRVEGAGSRPLVLDLAAVTFVDSSALRELLRVRMERERRGGRLVLAAVPPALMRLLELTRTAALFETAPTREDALARVQG